ALFRAHLSPLRPGRPGRGVVLPQVRVHPPAGGVPWTGSSPTASRRGSGSWVGPPAARVCPAPPPVRAGRASGRLRGPPGGRAWRGRTYPAPSAGEVLCAMRDAHRAPRRLLSGMSATSAVRRGGRRGRRTGSMVRIAGERIADLFALAEREAVASHGDLAHRYVVLARKVGMRYNVRLLREYRELYCRTC